MEILQEHMTKKKLQEKARALFGDMVKGVVDVDKGLLAIDAELHADLEALLLEHGSEQNNVWGINLYPELDGDDFIEFDSMINIRPSQGNRSRSIDSPEIQNKVISIVNRWITR
jgi:hypothetical protein